MTNPITTLPAGAAIVTDTRFGKDSNCKLSEAARQFEALLLAQILKSARQASSGGLAGETDAAGGCAMEFAEEQVAALLAERGGLGIANVIVAGIMKEQGGINSAQDAAAVSSLAETPRS